jgi:hypothetical protein
MAEIETLELLRGRRLELPSDHFVWNAVHNLAPGTRQRRPFTAPLAAGLAADETAAREFWDRWPRMKKWRGRG